MARRGGTRPLLLAALVVLVAAMLPARAAARDAFEQWASEHGKTYKSEAERDRRRAVFDENSRVVDTINSEGLSWRAGLNQFSDMTPDEFRTQVLMRPRKAPAGAAARPPPQKKTETVPAAFDWRASGAVSSVKDQGFVGTCWAFSTVGNVEGVWAIKNNKAAAESLSPEFLVDCDGTTDEPNNRADCSVFGGWPYLAYQYIASRGGIPSEASYGYCAGTGSCYPCMEGPTSLCGPPPYSCDRSRTQACKALGPADFAAKVADWVQADASEEAVTSLLATTAPLSVLLDATGLQYYSSGIWTGYRSDPRLGCSQTGLNHAVLLVGFNVSSDGGAAQPFYSIKNR